MSLPFCAVICVFSCLCTAAAGAESDGLFGIELEEATPFATVIRDTLPHLPNLTWISSIDVYNPPIKKDYSSRKRESAACLRDLLFIGEQMTGKAGHVLPDWFVSMADSAGKIPSGITTGALSWPGYFRQCLEVRATGQRPFLGRYCSVYWAVGLNNGSLIAPLTQGLCVPDSCTTPDINNHISVISELLLKVPKIRKLIGDRIKLQGVYCHPRPEERHPDGPAVASLSALFVVVIIVIIATIADIAFLQSAQQEPATWESEDLTSSSDEQTSPTTTEDSAILTSSSGSGTSRRASLAFQILNSFSLYSNMKRLVSTKTNRSREISSLNGIRFLSMAWVILCHSCLFSLSVTNNLLDLVKDSDSLSFYLILNGSFCVDSFFVLSGLLLSYNYFTPSSGNNSDGWKMRQHPVIGGFLVFLKRIYRILPLYLAVLIFDANLTHLGSSGPFWDYGDQVTSEKVLCSQSAWYNVLFINNFLPLQKQCMAWTWYLANDMQFFLISPLILFLVKRNRKLGLALIVSLLLATISATWVVSYTNRLSTGFPAMLRHLDPEAITSYLDTIYAKPYARAGPFLIGLLVGLLLVEERQVNITRRKRAVAYVVACLLLVLVLFGNYHSQPNRLSDAFYNSLSRVSWAFLVCLIIVLTTDGSHHSRNKVSPISSFLSFSFFVPLSKLTYCAYLIHPLVINFYYRTLQEPLLYNGQGMLSIYLSNVVAVFLFAVPVHLVFEAPFAQVLKTL